MVAREQPLVARERTVNLFFLLILKEIGLTFEEDAKTVAKREFSQMSLDCKKKKKKDAIDIINLCRRFLYDGS